MQAWQKLLSRIMALAAGLALLFWLATLRQPLIDQHEFRQTQTALSALFMGSGLQGFIAYETPVVGNPWSIPFEFPLYQWLVRLASRLLPLSLSSCGRLISLCFGIACLVPAIDILRQFGISINGQKLLVILLFTSSIYLYWNRSFTIESTALFFTLSSLSIYGRIRDLFRQRIVGRRRFWWLALLILVSSSLALLIKATTALPALLLMALDGLIHLAQAVISPGQRRNINLPRLLVIGGFLIAAVAVMRAWTHHADSLKLLNPIGQAMTSQALNDWNFGTPQQRLSAELWKGVLIERMLTPLGAIPGVLLLTGGVVVAHPQLEKRLFLAACLWMAFGPLLIFSNLHIVHNYYQTANQIYWLMALAASASFLLEARRRIWLRLMAIGCTGLVVAGSLTDFWQDSHYFSDALPTESDKLRIGRLIQANTSPEDVILVLDNDWSSAFAYHSQRRSMAVPDWYRPEAQQQILNQADRSWLGGHRLGAVIRRRPSITAPADGWETLCAITEPQSFSDWQVLLCDSQHSDSQGTQQDWTRRG